MIFSPEERVQRELNYALVDEVDSILIDEARTPLIISGPSENSSELYKEINMIVPFLISQKKKIQKILKALVIFLLMKNQNKYI